MTLYYSCLKRYFSKTWHFLLFGIVLVTALQIHPAFAQISFSSPNVLTKVGACDDFATSELHNPWDMTDSQDINNYFPGVDISGFSSPAISSGFFSGVSTDFSPIFYLISPQVCGSYPVGGRWGQDLSLSTSKYTKLSVRLNSSVADDRGLRMIWDRSCSYANVRSVTTGVPIQAGWSTYTIDLPSTTIESGQSTSTSSWAAGSINGLAILPTTAIGNQIQIDWIRLEDPSSCGMASASYTATPNGMNNYYSVWLDTDSNPFNGFASQLRSSNAASGADSASLSSLGVAPANYHVIGLLDSDFRTLEYANPWDMSDNGDITSTNAISNGSFSNALGNYTGTTGSEASILLNVGGGISAAKYTKLSLRLARSTGSNPTGIIIFYNNGNGFQSYSVQAGDSIGNDTYNIDMSGKSGWSGTISTFIIRPDVVAGTNFSLDFASLRADGFDSSRSADSLVSSIVSANGTIQINQAPTIEFKNPGIKSGEALKPWNMNSGDLVVFANLNGATDSNHPTERLTTFLPDVRYVDGVRGDLFKGTNTSGSDDPTNYSTFPYGIKSPISFDSSAYKNLCFRLLIDRPFDLGLGSVARVFWKSTTEGFKTSEDIVLINDGWSGSHWYEYCTDMTKIYLDGTTNSSWTGTIEAFRVDAHEFTDATTFYFDSIKLRRDSASRGNQFAIVVHTQDSDDAATTQLYYNANPSTTGGSLIGTIGEDSNSYIWDTSGVPNGTYYIYGVASDGTNSTARLASGRVVVNNATASGSEPALSLQSPTEGGTFCDILQVKGYALQPDRFENVAAVELYIDNVLQSVVYPSEYSNAAKTAYPSMDSSNTGFNQAVSTSAISVGTHQVKTKAIGSDGRFTEQTVTMTRQAGGCGSLLTDADPSGVPVELPNSQVPNVPQPVISRFSHDSRGNVNLTVQKAGDRTCSLKLFLGKNSSSIASLAKTHKVTARQAKSGNVTLKASGIRINKRKLKSVTAKVVKTCSGSSAISSSAKTFSTKTSSGNVASVSSLARALSRGLR